MLEEYSSARGSFSIAWGRMEKGPARPIFLEKATNKKIRACESKYRCNSGGALDVVFASITSISMHEGE